MDAAENSTAPDALTAQYPVVAQVEVRWGDMDAFQHVNNTVYFRYFEQVRIAYFNRAFDSSGWSGGMPSGVGPILYSTSCRFRAPVTYPDTLFIGARTTQLGADRFTMQFGVYSEQLGRIAAEGEAVVVSFDYSTGRKADLPQEWVDAIERIEAGGPDQEQ